MAVAAAASAGTAGTLTSLSPATSLSQPFTQEDRDYLRARGIPVELAVAAGLRGVTAEEATNLLGRARPVGSAGIFIPYPGVTPAYHRIRFHDPDAAGARYLTMVGREVPIYTVDPSLKAATPAPPVPPGLAEVLFVVESPVKALALAAVGLEAAGLSGTATTLEERHGARRLNSTWPRDSLVGRDVMLVFDAGRSINPAVARDEARLARALTDVGAKVSVAALPLAAGEDQGPDDFIVTHGAGALFSVLAAGLPGGPVERVRAVQANNGVVADLLDDLPFLFSVIEASAGVKSKVLAALLGAGLSKKDITDALKGARQRSALSKGGTGPALGDHLTVVDGRICKALGECSVPLANFDARIVEELVLDDGAVQERTLKVVGTMEDGTSLPTVSMKVEELADSRWPLRYWGSRAIVANSKLAGDDLRLAIQKFSSPKVNRIFAHTGWRTLTDATGVESGLPVFLHAGGALGGDGVAVRLENQMAMYRLPDEIVEPVDAVRHSLDLLDLGPSEVMVPLLALPYRAPLQSALAADVSVYLVGKTGSLKTSVAKLAAAHFGQRLAERPVATFQASVPAIEMVLNKAKDVLVLLDDFKPRNREDKAHGKAHEVFSSVGDQEGRGRMQQDGSVRPARPPRALVLATGETPPAGESTVARLLLLQLSRGDVDIEKLTAAQATAPRLPHAMAAYIKFLQPRMPGIEEELRQKHLELRRRFEDATPGGHLRSPSALAHIALGYEYCLPFAVEIGAIDRARAKKIRTDVFDALDALGRQGASTSRDTDPVLRFLDFLRTLLQQGKVRVGCEDEVLGRTSGSGEPLGEPIGWNGEKHLYLLGEAAYAAVKRAMDQAGEDMPHAERVLWARLRDGRLVEAGDREGRNTVRRQLGGKRTEVIALKKLALWPDGDGPEGGPEGHGGGGGGAGRPQVLSDHADFSGEARTTEATERTTAATDRTKDGAATSGAKAGQPPEISCEGPRAEGLLGPVGPHENEREERDGRSEHAPNCLVDACRSVAVSATTGPTGPVAQAPAKTAESSRALAFGLDQLDQSPAETAADGLGLLRATPALRTPVWCLRASETLLQLDAPTVGTPNTRRRELERQLREARLLSVAQLEFALQPVVVEMQAVGVGVDLAAWAELVQHAEADLARARAELLRLGLARPDYDQAALKVLASRGLAVSSTRDTALSQHAEDPLVSELRRFRRAAGFLNSTGRSVLAAARKGGGRAHAAFDPLAAPTGRMACSKPNLLSIPKAPEHRRCIVPAPGHVFVVADYAAIELRILAAVTGDATLQQVFRDRIDPHAATAASLFGKTISSVCKDERQAGKAVNFGFAYGMSPATFVEYAHDYGVELSMDQARAHRAAFLAAYPGIAAWQLKVKSSTATEARSLGGRRVLFKAGSTVPQRLNAPAQATCADGLKLAMVVLHERLKPLGAHMVLAVHDELLVEAPTAVAEQTRQTVQATMVGAMQSLLKTVPVEVKISVRASWVEGA